MFIKGIVSFILRINMISVLCYNPEFVWYQSCLILDTYGIWCCGFIWFFNFIFKSWWPYCALLSKRARRRTLWQFLNELIFLFLVSQWSLVPPLPTLARISHRLCSLARGLMDMSKIAKIRTNGMGFNGLYLLSLLSSKIVT